MGSNPKLAESTMEIRKGLQADIAPNLRFTAVPDEDELHYDWRNPLLQPGFVLDSKFRLSEEQVGRLVTTLRGRGDVRSVRLASDKIEIVYSIGHLRGAKRDAAVEALKREIAKQIAWVMTENVKSLSVF